jgi:hypothetical protein
MLPLAVLIRTVTAMLKIVQPGSRQSVQTADASRPALLRSSHPPVRSESGLARMQSAYGNQGMQRLLSGSVLQRKLAINQPGDVYEQEADRVADSVMRMQDPAALPERMSQVRSACVQRACSCGSSGGASGECEECKAKATGLQRSSAGPSRSDSAPPIVHDVLRSSGQPLDTATRSFMEPRFGADFSGVRVHTDAEAAESARAVNALAYTVGNSVVFGSGQYAPSNPVGGRLLAHELTHVLQQGFEYLEGGAALQRALGPCPDVVTPHALLKKDAQDPGVREVQRKLNLFDEEEKANGRPGLKNAPLNEDCIFGELTFGAVVDFQKHVFPTDQREHDGDVGPHTWTELDKISGTPTPQPDLPAPASPTDPQSRIKNVNLTFGTTPHLIRKGPSRGALVVTLNDPLFVLGSADLEGGADCDKFRFGFVQMCRPFHVANMIFHSPSSGEDIMLDRSAKVRALQPLLDVFSVGDRFSFAESPATQATRCAEKRALKHAFVLFQDIPNFPVPVSSSDPFLASLAWQTFFLTSFAVQVPDGSMRHLQSFFWEIKYCEIFSQPPAGSLLGSSMALSATVAVHPPARGMTDPDLLRLSGSPASNTCNAAGNVPLEPGQHPGPFTITCPIP